MRIQQLLIPLLAAIFVAASSSPSVENTEEKLQTPFGTLIGFSGNGCDTWLGIPYAKPPVGELRFANTVPWDQPYDDNEWDATKRGAFCVQNKIGDSEDCLYLNIWRPTSNNAVSPEESREKENDSPLLPVMIFIHGGAFTTGSSVSSVPFPPIMEEYNGCHLSKEQNIIVASMNYRLGPFGFATFDDEEGKTAASNFGLRDQLSAIQWLQGHVSLFGGNPKAMTVFGESAGAMSVLAHLASPESHDLFQGAISQSGYPVAFSWNQGINVTREFSNQAGCRNLDPSSLRFCLRTKSVKELTKAAGDSLDGTKWLLQTGWKPVVDGSFLPQHPLKLLQNKKESVPLLIGWNTDDSSLFLRLNYPIGFWFNYQYDTWLRKFTRTHNIETEFNSTDIQQVKNLYKDISSLKQNQKVTMIETDGSFFSGAKAAAQAYNNNDIFMYRFNQIPSCSSLKILAEGVYHTLELPFIFNTANQYFCNFDEKDEAVALRMRTMWANFAKYQNPSLRYDEQGNIPYSTAQDVMFPKYPDASQNLVFDGDGDYVENNYEDHYFSFWQEKIFNKFLLLDMGPPPEEEKE